MDTKESVRQFITKNFFVADQSKLGDDASLLDQGIIDSTGVLELVGYLESEHGVQVADDEIVPENLDSVGAIAAYIARKKGG